MTIIKVFFIFFRTNKHRLIGKEIKASVVQKYNFSKEHYNKRCDENGFDFEPMLLVHRDQTHLTEHELYCGRATK